MSQYWPEFLTIAVAHLLAVASPGPDFAVVLRQALCQSRRNAWLTALGVGTGILVHVAYSLLGIGLLIQQSLVLFNVLKVVGALYLLWIAFQCLRARAGALEVVMESQREQAPGAAFRLGFLTNALNPKATLFFVALFSVVISPGTPVAVQAVTVYTWPLPPRPGSPWWRCSSPCPGFVGPSPASGTGWTA